MRSRHFTKFPIIILACLLTLFCVQWYSLSIFFKVQRIEFNKSINNTLERTLSDQRVVITDSICSSMYRWLMDTSITKMSTKTYPKRKSHVYVIEDVNAVQPQSVEFSLKFETRPIVNNDEKVKKIIAEHLVNAFRKNYLNYQVVYYSTANVGDSASELSERLRFDTGFFREAFRKKLVSQQIDTRFQLQYLSSKDTALYRKLQDQSSSTTAIQTKVFPSDRYDKDRLVYVYAVFEDPSKWIYRKMLLPFIVSLLIVTGVAVLLLYLYKVIRKQKQLAELKNDFIDNMTHELKTPIATISAAAEAMQEFGAQNDKQKSEKYLHAIRTQSSQLGNIVNKVLDISTFEKQEISLRKMNTSITQILQEVKENQSLLQNEKSPAITIPDQEFSVLGDPFHLRNVFFNLVDNAVKYNDKEKVEIQISTEDNADALVVRVRDNGRGIEKESIPYLFDKFYRVPQGNVQRVKGFGLGLFYVKRIIEMHGAAISVQSKPGIETIVSIKFPKTTVA